MARDTGSGNASTYIIIDGKKYQAIAQAQKPGSSYTYYGQTKAGVNIWVKGYSGPSLGTTTGGTSGGGGSGGGGASGGGGRSSSGGSSASDQYLQLYRNILDDRSAKPPSGLISKAVAGNWSSAYFQLQVRKTDKAYLKSPAAEKRMLQFKDYWGALFPGEKLRANIAVQYVRGVDDLNTFFRTRIVPSKLFKREFKNWNTWVNKQRQMGNAKVATDPLAYKQYQAAFLDAYKQMGTPVTPGYEKEFFKSGLTPDQFAGNLQLLGQTGSAFQWQTGQQANQKQALFNQPGAANLRGRLQNALATQASFFTSGQSVFQAEKEDGLIKQGI